VLAEAVEVRAVAEAPAEAVVALEVAVELVEEAEVQPAAVVAEPAGAARAALSGNSMSRFRSNRCRSLRRQR
jgi:hypothetical protein